MVFPGRPVDTPGDRPDPKEHFAVNMGLRIIAKDWSSERINNGD